MYTCQTKLPSYRNLRQCFQTNASSALFCDAPHQSARHEKTIRTASPATLFGELLEETLEKGLSTRELTRRIGEEQATNKDEDEDEDAGYEADNYDILKCLDDEDQKDQDEDDVEDDEDQDQDDDDPIEVALAYFESGGELNDTWEFLGTADLDATNPENLTPNQRYRLEALAAETEHAMQFLGFRLTSLYRLLGPETETLEATQQSRQG